MGTYTGTKAQAGRGFKLAIGANISITGDTTSASTSVANVSSTAGISVGMPISGAGVPVGATIASIGAGTLTLSAAATATATGVALTVDASSDIGEANDFPFDRPEWQTADATNFDSGDDSEQIVTIRKSSSFTVTGNRVGSDAGQVRVETAYQSGALQAFTGTLPKRADQTVSGDKVAFNANVLGSNFKVGVDKIVQFEIKLMLSGPALMTQGS